MKKISVTFLFLMSVLVSFAQVDVDDSFTLEIGLPNNFSNVPNKTIMQGLICVSPSYQYAFKSGLAIGIGLHYTYFNINQFRVTEKVFGGIHNGAAYVKIGHEKFWGDFFGTDFGVKLGYMESYSNTNLLRYKGMQFKRTQAFYIEPTMAFILASDVNASFRLTVSYPFYGYSFSPEMIGVSTSLGYTADQISKTNSALTVGFGYTRYFNGKKSSSGGDDE
jgi:hypothetical protein